MARPTSGDDRGPSRLDGPESTASLLARVRQGDEAARNRLISRYLPAFRRWAHGRVPNQARGLIDTDDLVQDSLLRALKHVDGFESRHSGAFLAYLRRILMNQIREHARRAKRLPVHDELADNLAGGGASQLEAVVGHEVVEAYEAALAHLTEDQRQAVLLRLELQFTYEEIAQEIASPSANAARMTVKRALLRLAEEMEHVRRDH